MRELDAYPVALAYQYGSLTRSGGMGALVCENFHIIQDIVGDTDCSWLVAGAMIADDIAANRLVTLNVTDLPVAEAEISIVYLRDRTRSPASLELVEHIRTLVADMAIA
jgi:DNA-binding transcriptional LysR family regulator